MKKLYQILLLSNNASLFNKINKIFSEAEIVQISLQNLVAELSNPLVYLIIVDFDEYKNDILEIIREAEFFDYMPLIFITSNTISNKRNELLKKQCLLHKNSISHSLKNIASHLIQLKFKYESLRVSYEIVDTINSKSDKIMKNISFIEEFDYTKWLNILFDPIFSNPYLNNKPQKIMYSSIDCDVSEIKLYKITQNGSKLKLIKNKRLVNVPLHGLNLKVENEVISNCDEKEFSDIGNYKYWFSKPLLDIIGELKNFVGYTTLGTGLLAFNYNRRVSKQEADIIKNLCINFNLIKNIVLEMNNVNKSFIYTTNALARAAEVNDEDTGNHIKRVNLFSKLISEELGMNKKFISTILYSAQMHDVGKIHIPNTILNKRGPLTEAEFNMIKNHTIYGKKIIGNAPNLLMAGDIALNHHEKFDGTGYPNRRSGKDIPLAARIVFLADIYDALRSVRVYKPGFDTKKTYKIIINGDNRVMPEHFDPEILNIYKKNHKKFDEIYDSLS
jgi:response regulator RpfG family c-di-GMP phosphodiesterase